MSGKKSRAKGIRGELEVCRIFSEGLGQSFERNLTQTRAGGGDLLEILGFVIEVKRVERLAIPAWWRQAVRQAEDAGREPILAFRKNREDWRFLVKTVDGYRETNEVGILEHVRDKWMRLYAEYPVLNGVAYG